MLGLLLAGIGLIVIGILVQRHEERQNAKYWNRLWVTRKWGDDG